MLEGRYELPLVIVSIVVAVFASYTALSLAGRVHQSQGKAARAWIAGGAFAMGTGVWAMHFVGMLAFRLPIPLGYDLGITLLSWLIPIVASALALKQITRPDAGAFELATSAVLIGLGINAMHYLGMAAMRMEPGIVWDWGLVALSVLIAIAAAGTSFWLAARLRQDTPQAWRGRAVAATVMGLAIVGMHYTGMAAAGFPQGSVCLSANTVFSLAGLSTLVTVATVAVLAIALIASVYDARLSARNDILALSQQLAEERQVLLESERAAREEAEHLSALKDQFLATLSHELRTPLNAVQGWVQLLRHRSDPATLARGLQVIERNARLQAQLIEDLLDISRIVTGKVRLECAWIELADVLDAALETIRPAAVAKQIELSTELGRGFGRVWGDHARLQQVLWNLLSNAIKFTPAEGRVSVRLAGAAGFATVVIEDNGSGISPEFLPHVFERFRQAEAGSARRFGGLGIGLSIVRQLVELHGGTVTAQSGGEGQGACFTLRLPLGELRTPVREADPLSRQPELTGLAAFEPRDLSQLRVLVVDDAADARQLAGELLRACGASCQLADGAGAAMAWLHGPDAQAFDVLVSDIGMPIVDGFELIRRVRQLPTHACAIPALALTAFAGPADEEQALQAGFDAWLAKPIDASLFVEQVAQLAAQVPPAPPAPPATASTHGDQQAPSRA